MNVLILGAGPTGLGAAHRLNELGHDNWSLYEREHHVGGLSASFVDEQGFTWDVGGHVLFSHYDYFDKAVSGALGNAYHEHLRESWIRILQTWVPYPFQNNIRHLPDDALKECIDGLRLVKGDPKQTGNFLDWMHDVFGRGIVAYFMQPYNEKVWALPLERMSRDWIAERVSLVDLQRIERNIAEAKDDVNWGPNNTFRFPKIGGTGAIFEGIARPLRRGIQFHHEFSSINLREKWVQFSNGRREHYDALINTSPLDAFVEHCVDAPSDIRDAASRLEHNSGLIVGLGFSGRRIDPKCWMYFPEDNCPFYRVTNFHNYAPYNVPDGAVDSYFSLMCETSYSAFKKVDKAAIIKRTAGGLVASGMIREHEAKSIVSRYLIDIPYSYPIPTIGRDVALSVIQTYLEGNQVYSRGRFGAWKYEVGNMDHSFMQGVEVVDRILSGQEESTLPGRL